MRGTIRDLISSEKAAREVTDRGKAWSSQGLMGDFWKEK
jgi:hypothetical protein